MTEPETTNEIKSAITSWTASAQALAISDEPSYRSAADLLLQVRDLRAQVNATFDPVIAAAHTAHKAALAAKAEHEGPLAAAEKVVKGRMAAYVAEQERARRAEQLRLEAIARREEEERRLAEAQAAADAGDAEMADALLEAPIVAPVVAPVAPAVPKIAGVVYRTTWHADVVDLMALVRFVAGHPEFGNLVMANVPALNSLAVAQKDAMQIPGVRPVSVRS